MKIPKMTEKPKIPNWITQRITQMEREKQEHNLRIKKATPWYTYIIQCETPDHFYIGISQNIKHRIERHKLRKGSRFTQMHGAKSAIYIENNQTYEQAKNREKLLTKQWKQFLGNENISGGMLTTQERLEYTEWYC